MTKKRILLCVILCMALAILGACGKSKSSKETSTSAKTVTYSVEVKTEGDMALSGVTVFIYADNTLADMVWAAATDEAGMLTFDAKESSSYVAVLQDVPEGYTVEASYPLTGELTQIVVGTAVVEVEDWTQIEYKVGDVIHNFSVTTPDGTEYQIADLLKEKQAIVLNFWYTTCDPCKEEFPYLQEAYEQFKDQLIVLAMNPIDSDQATIKQFAEDNKLTFPVVACEPEWEKVMKIAGYPTTVVIDRFGVISLIHSGAITNTESFVELFSQFVSEDYQQKVIENLEDVVTYEPEEGTKDNAEELGGLQEFEATVKGKGLRYYDLYKVDGMMMYVYGDDAYIEYNGKTYKAKNGVAQVMLHTEDTYTPAKFAIGNKGKKKQTFQVKLGYLKGHYGNPYTLEMGKFNTHVDAGNDQGVYYRYKATQEGELTLKCLSSTKGVDYDFVLYNLDSYEYRSFATDGTTNKKGVRSLVVKVKKGQTVQFSVNPLPDENNEYPAANFTFKASFEKKKVASAAKDTRIDYTVTVLDDAGKPLSNVAVKIGDSHAKTNDKGVATVLLEKGKYTASVTLPKGYKADQTKFTLTRKSPSVTVTLTKIVIVMQDYKITVVDEEGNPIEGTIVSMGSTFATTDATGIVTLNMEKKEYAVLISPPDGYVTQESSYKMTADMKELTVVVLVDETEDEDDGKLNYSVKVVDYQQKPIANVAVSFYSGETMVAMKQVDEFGNVTASLEPGEYHIDIAFPAGSNYYVDPSDLLLTAENTSTQVLVANVLTKSENYYFDSDTYIIDIGGSYAEMQADVLNYFILRPSVSGQYRVSVSNPNAELSYRGGNTSFEFDQTSSTDYDGTGLTINVKDGNVGTDADSGVSYIYAITGVESCIIQVVRIGDPILDDTDVPYTIYQPNPTPTEFTLTIPSGKKLEYVDVLNGKTSNFKAVYNSADGYYHLNSANGPVLYLTLSGAAPYLSLETMISTASIRKYFYNGDVLEKKEDYWDCVNAYATCKDKKTGVYPLTEDLKYILQEYGEYIGWWDPSSYAYLFGNSTVNTDIAWMYACCYLK